MVFTQGSSSPVRLGPTLGWMMESFQDSKGAPRLVCPLIGKRVAQMGQGKAELSLPASDLTYFYLKMSSILRSEN